MKKAEFDKDVKKAITAEKRKEQKDFLRSLEDSLSESNQSSKGFNWRIAASVAVLIGLVSSFFLFNQTPSSEQLYDDYFTPYSNVVAPVVRDQISLSKKASAFAAYEKGDYKQAIKELSLLTVQDSLEVSTRDFFMANAHLQLNQFEEAKKLLQQVVDQNKEWKDESIWYLALISLKMNNLDTSVSYLKELQQNSNVFKSKVDSLLITLE